jgi:Phage integrase family
VLHVRRVKNGTSSTHPIQGDELRALSRLHRESPASPFVFVSERGSPFTTAGFARMIERAAAAAGLELKAHPHCGTRAATPWPTRGTTPGRSRAGWAIGPSPARRSTRRWHRTGSRTSGGIDRRGRFRQTEAAVEWAKKERRRFNERLQEGCKGRGQALKKEEKKIDKITKHLPKKEKI